MISAIVNLITEFSGGGTSVSTSVNANAALKIIFLPFENTLSHHYLLDSVLQNYNIFASVSKYIIHILIIKHEN